MATKAELEAELALLRQQITDRDREDAEKTMKDEESSPLGSYLSEHGLDQKDIAAFWDQLSKELGNLPQNKPILTALGAFGLGLLLGRLSRH